MYAFPSAYDRLIAHFEEMSMSRLCVQSPPTDACGLHAHFKCLSFELATKTYATGRWVHSAKEVTELENALAESKSRLADAKRRTKELKIKVEKIEDEFSDACD